jgi:hypothetical protein
LRKYLVFIYVFFAFFCFSEDNLSDFNKIIYIDKKDESLIKSNSYDWNDLDILYYYSQVSETSIKVEDYKSWYYKISNTIESLLIKDFGRTDILNLDLKIQKKVAENILIYLHNLIFNKYSADSDTIDLLINNGEFNCVSSSILYALFLRKYGFDVYGMEVPDHVFIEIDFHDEKIDVETTNKFGFDPGKKKEVLDEFGKLTGLTYVPAKDYKNRNKIDLKKLIFLVYHNSANLYFDKKDYLKSVNLGYLVYLGRNDKKGNEDFYAHFYNYIVVLKHSKKYLEAVLLIDDFFEYFGVSNNFSDLRFDLLQDFIFEWNDYKSLKNIKNYLLTENSKFGNLKNSQRFIEIYFNFYIKIVEYFNSIKDFERSYSEIKEFNKQYKNSEMEKLFSNTLIENMVFLENKSVVNKLMELTTVFPEYKSIIEDKERIFLINEANKIFNSGDYFSALNEAKKLKTIYTDDSDVLLLIKNCYVGFTIQMYNLKDFEKAISFSEESLKIFPDEKIFLNNYKVFYQDYIGDLILNKDYYKARIMINKSLELFKNESIFIQYDKNLKQKNY